MGFVCARHRAGEVRAEATVEHCVLTHCFGVAEGAHERAGAVGGGAAAEAMRGAGHFDCDVGAVLRGEERPGLERAADRAPGFGERPALVVHLEQRRSGST